MEAWEVTTSTFRQVQELVTDFVFVTDSEVPEP